jgi:hypothetical protein
MLPIGSGAEQSAQFIIPFVILLAVFKKIFISSYLVITVYNSLSLVFGFLGMFFVIREVLNLFRTKEPFNKIGAEISSLLGALFYMFSPMLVRGNWSVALFDHSKIFVYPWIVYFLLLFLRTERFQYLLYIVIVSFIFSHNFFSEPKFFSFFIFVVLYLLLYKVFVQATKVKIKKVVMFLFLFFCAHLFHLLPMVNSIFNPNNVLRSRIVGANVRQEAINYFLSVVPSIKLSGNLLGLAPMIESVFSPFFIIFLFIIVISLIVNSRSVLVSLSGRMNFTLLIMILLALLFLITGKVTDFGISLYKFMFYIPGFSMFRNYYGQWMFGYVFFYSIIIGLSIYSITIHYLKQKHLMYCLYTVILTVIIVGGWPFISGDVVRTTLVKNLDIEIKAVFKPDPVYFEALDYIRTIPDQGKFITLPINDYFYHIVEGVEGGVYLGTSPISYLTGKNDFPGYQNLKPFSEILQRMTKDKDYEGINRVLGLLNIRYIFYNSNPYIIDNFTDFPYQHAKQYFPANQEEYQKFIGNLRAKKIRSFGSNYHIYTLDDKYFHQLIYASTELVNSDHTMNDAGYINEHFVNNEQYFRNIVYVDLDSSDVKISNITPKPSIVYNRINPTYYTVEIRDVSMPFMLVLSETYNTNWKLSTLDSNPDSDIKSHHLVNGYANGWYIEPSNIDENQNYSLLLEFMPQRLFYIGIFISVLTVISCSVWLVMLQSKSFQKLNNGS